MRDVGTALSSRYRRNVDDLAKVPGLQFSETLSEVITMPRTLPA